MRRAWVSPNWLDTEMLIFSSAPLLVVTRITPLAPLTPNTAVEDASLSTVMLSISFGSIWKKDLSTPSTRMRGVDAVLDREPVPRTKI